MRKRNYPQIGGGEENSHYGGIGMTYTPSKGRANKRYRQKHPHHKNQKRKHMEGSGLKKIILSSD